MDASFVCALDCEIQSAEVLGGRGEGVCACVDQESEQRFAAVGGCDVEGCEPGGGSGVDEEGGGEEDWEDVGVGGRCRFVEERFLVLVCCVDVCALD